jgi:hypothetical protein
LQRQIIIQEFESLISRRLKTSVQPSIPHAAPLNRPSSYLMKICRIMKAVTTLPTSIMPNDIGAIDWRPMSSPSKSFLQKRTNLNYRGPAHSIKPT